jgi:Tol biopolymer transport system component
MRAKTAYAAAALAALAALLGTSRAQATYPGANGRIAFGWTAPGTTNPDIYSVLPNGSGLRQLTHDSDFDACPAYSADGKWIAYCRAPSATSPQLDIWMMKQNGHDQHLVISSAAAGRTGFPDFSPDGSKLAFVCSPPGDATGPDVCTSGVDGSGLTQITASPGLDLFPAWSPDGNTIVFLSNRSGTMQVWLMNADGSGQHQLTFGPAPKDQVPDWSPDGSKIVYLVDVPGGPGGDVWVMNADGTDQHQVGSGERRFGPTWSPDGTQIVYITQPEPRQVEVMNADGSDPHVVAPGGGHFVPAWQPHPEDSGDDG